MQGQKGVYKEKNQDMQFQIWSNNREYFKIADLWART